MGDRGSSNQRAEAGHTQESAACERLYRNAAEQAARLQRRLQVLREAQEAEFRANCTFRPSVNTAKEGFRERHTSQRVRSHSAGVMGSRRARSTTAGTGAGGGGARPRRAKSSSAVQRSPSRLRRQSLAAPEETSPILYACVPRCVSCKHQRADQESDKGCNGTVDGLSEHLTGFMNGTQSPGTTATRFPSAFTRSCQPGGGAARVSTSLPDDTSRGCRPPQSQSDPGGVPLRIFTTPQHQTQACCGAHAQNTTGEDDTAAAALPQVPNSLSRDSDDRRAVRALIQLMGEHEELPHAKSARNGASKWAHTPRNRQWSTSLGLRRSRALCNKDTTAAIALASGGAASPGIARQRADADRPVAVRHTVFHARCGEQEELQRRLERQQMQRKGGKEKYTFPTFSNAQGGAPVEEGAWRHTERTSAAAETGREGHPQNAADAEAKETACRAQVRFSYPAFSKRQVERDRRRTEELVALLLHERSDDVCECRFRPALSKLTEVMAEGKRHYIPLTHYPTPAQQRMGAGMCRTAKRSVTATANARTPLPFSGKRTPRARGMRASTSAVTRDREPASLEDLERFATDGPEGGGALQSGAPPLQQWHDFACASGALTPTVGATKSLEQPPYPQVGAPHASARAHSLPDVNRRAGASLGPSAVEAPRLQGATKEDMGTVHIAGTASSTYLRQLELELQDALRG
ncbi:hypothetical protein LSCM1_01909 [Leishmania martiniquensis]|uniref:Uncharacterized protein n=1 Tax=Leishmania martiniquensis TaxID=1580590 RepID=A0A836KM11_9TRYP|nr:hypothetical protein LSCM1_01909 [Leishmania martiniquensis]